MMPVSTGTNLPAGPSASSDDELECSQVHNICLLLGAVLIAHFKCMEDTSSSPLETPQAFVDPGAVFAGVISLTNLETKFKFQTALFVSRYFRINCHLIMKIRGPLLHIYGIVATCHKHT